MDESKPPTRWSVRVGVWLLCLTIVPLTGAGVLAAGEMRSVQESREEVADIHDVADDLVLLTEMRSAILDEGNWQSGLVGIEQMGLDSAIVAEWTGVDVAAQLSAARAKVDVTLARLADLPDPEIAEIQRGVLAMRASALRDAVAIADTFDRFERDAAEVAERKLGHLVDVVGDADGAGELNRALRMLEMAVVARQAVTVQFMSYWSAQYDPDSSDRAEILTIIEQRDRRDDAVAAIAAIAPSDSAIRTVMVDLALSMEKQVFDNELDDIVDRVFAGDRISDPQLVNVLDNIEQVGRVFVAGTFVVDGHLDLVTAAGHDMVTATEAIDRSSDERIRRAAITVAIIAFATLGFAGAVAAIIGRPLRKLADSATRLSAGDTDVRAKPAGPTEVRLATAALNEAVDHLALAERQANALAEGLFDDEVLHRPSRGALGSSLQSAVGTLTRSLADREEFRRRLSHEARHDSLTKVPNRRAVMAHLERSLARTRRTGTLLAVMFIDLDGFKAVNDLEGHPVGDAVLRAVAERLVNGVREGDQIGRRGGDEFLVVAEPVSGPEEAVHLAERLRLVVSEPVSVAGMMLSVSACVGIALVDADSTLSADEVLRDADLAVYKAKSEGRSRIALCDEALRAELDARADVEHSVRAAIDEDQFVLHYQPIVQPGSGALLAVEALVRWQRPGFGLIAPDQFIPHAERSDLIVDIDRWVIDHVAEQICAWEQDPELAGVPVAVNVSGRHLGRPDFAEGIFERLYRRGASPTQLIIEVTESALLHDLDRAAVQLQKLRDHGVRISIDDFGTGYTSLAHLRTLPVDILKIDRSFTADSSAESLVKLIIDTGHLLGARITAEGIETAEQAATLALLGSDELQGFLYGRPTAADSLVEVIQRLSSGTGVAG